MSLIDLRAAKAAFQQYLEDFDQTDPRIRLKLVHTYGVVSRARQIGERMGLSLEDSELAQLIALLHDIGRFEQVRRFQSFEPSTMDHASFGVELLSASNRALLHRFLVDQELEDILLKAIALHSDYALPELAHQRTLLHARLIRDADKLDNCRVKVADSLEILLGVTQESFASVSEVGALPITPEVWKYCQDHQPVYSPVRKNRMDYWVSYVAYFYDVNFPPTAAIILEEDFVWRTINRLSYENPDTRQKMEQLGQEVTLHLKRLSTGQERGMEGQP